MDVIQKSTAAARHVAFSNISGTVKANWHAARTEAGSGSTPGMFLGSGKSPNSQKKLVKD